MSTTLFIDLMPTDLSLRLMKGGDSDTFIFCMILAVYLGQSSGSSIFIDTNFELSYSDSLIFILGSFSGFPVIADISLASPRIFRQSGRFGVDPSLTTGPLE